MNRGTLTRIEQRYGTIRCRYCEKRITVGQDVVTKYHSKRGGFSLKLYRAACYQATLR